jgi:hypothetical protein
MHEQDQEPFRLTPANAPEEKMLIRLFRLMSIFESIDDASQDGWPRPRLAADLDGAYRILLHLVMAVEAQIHRPHRIKVWMDREANAKNPPPRLDLLVHLLAIARASTTALIRAHDALALQEWEDLQHVAASNGWVDSEDLEEEERERREKPAGCWCSVCRVVFDIRWLLGKTRRLLAPALARIGQGNLRERKECSK